MPRSLVKLFLVLCLLCALPRIAEASKYLGPQVLVVDIRVTKVPVTRPKPTCDLRWEPEQRAGHTLVRGRVIRVVDGYTEWPRVLPLKRFVRQLGPVFVALLPKHAKRGNRVRVLLLPGPNTTYRSRYIGLSIVSKHLAARDYIDQVSLEVNREADDDEKATWAVTLGWQRYRIGQLRRGFTEETLELSLGDDCRKRGSGRWCLERARWSAERHTPRADSKREFDLTKCTSHGAVDLRPQGQSAKLFGKLRLLCGSRKLQLVLAGDKVTFPGALTEHEIKVSTTPGRHLTHCR